MTPTAAIRVEGLSKLYRRMGPGFPRRTLKSALLGHDDTAGLKPGETIDALSGLAFAVGRGEAFGVVGANGSGKSTLLKLLAGILRPTSGRVVIDGSVAALIELGAGFHPEISGRENVFINGAVLGLTRRQLAERFDSIVEFAGLADFIDEPVKSYSSGMFVRLGFAVAIHTDPDVLLIDEVLAVGDEAFGHRCLRRIEELLARGRTVLLVSHSLTLIEEMSDRVLWLEKGRQRLIGSPRRVVDAYRQAVAEAEGRAHHQRKEARERRIGAGSSPAGRGQDPSAAAADPGAPAVAAVAVPGAADDEPRRWGSRTAEIAHARLRDGSGAERYHFDSGETVVVEIEARSAAPLDDFVFGIAVVTPRGVEVWGTNTHLEGFAPARFDGTATVRVICPTLRLAPGEYAIDVAVHARDGAPYDYHRRLLDFSVTAATAGVGVYFPEHRWEFDGALAWRKTAERE